MENSPRAASVFQQRTASTPSNAEIWVWLSKSSLKARDWDKAVQALEKAAETLHTFLAGTLGEGDPGFEEVYYWLGEYFLTKGEKARAQEAFKSALAFDPEYSRAKDGLSKSQ